MDVNNVISLSKFKNSKLESSYKDKILGMDKLELLEEMVRFQSERSKIGYLTPKMLIEGIFLFQALENASETPELLALSKSYRHHLQYELEALKNG